MKKNHDTNGTKTNRLPYIIGFLLFSLVLNSQLLACKPIKDADIQGSQSTWDISKFGDLRYWSDKTGILGKSLEQDTLIKVPKTAGKEWNAGICWEEERDISRIEINYEGNVSEKMLKGTKIQYWSHTWPGEAPSPTQHTIEDHMDDPWHGTWLTAETEYQREGNKVVYVFKPITGKENKNAVNLPEPASYRRTLKIRMLYNSNPLPINSLKIYSPTKGKSVSVRIEFGCDNTDEKTMNGKLEIYNGRIERVSGWHLDRDDEFKTQQGAWNISLGKKSKGIIADLTVAEPTLPGSNDLSSVTVRSEQGTFSFLADDLVNGPIYIPTCSAYITYASDKTTFADSNIIKGETIRARLKSEPEQTYDRASREIPKLKVMLREDGGKLYLPLAADASWQKFGLEWGGNFFMDKYMTKAKGKELARCIWRDDVLRWSIGTGKEPVYIRDDKVSHMSILNDYLPVPQVNWNHEGLIYKEEGFVTLLEGPLSPYNEHRDEQTPAMLMIKLEVANPTFEEKTTHVWLKADSLDKLVLQDLFILDQINGENYIRANIKLPEGVSSSAIKVVRDAIDIPFSVPANQSVSLYLSVPFVGDLTGSSREKISSLDYSAERQRVVSYWRDIVNEFTAFNVPERKFNEMAGSVIPHIRMSATKDPKSGLYMVPAASFGYPVYANEAAFQTILLDKIGDHQTSANYLETFLKLQGSVPMPGTFTGDQSAVFHGAKVDDEYDYTAYNYNLDHGTVLWALGQHYLLSGDIDWLQHASPNMLKAADWIIEQRNQTKIKDKQGVPVVHYGMLPAGHLEDNSDWGYWFAVNAYAWLGLQTTAKAFKMAGLPQGKRLENEANSYLSDLRASVKRASELAPVVRLRNNTYVPYVPSRTQQRFRYFGPMKEGYYARYGKHTLLTYRLSATREALYGPLILITTGVIEPHDPLAGAILDDWEDNITLSSSLGQHIHGVVDDEYWFSRGGMVFQPNLQNPIQSYLLRKEVPAAIRSVYNSMVSCFYPDVNAFTEEYRRWSVGSGPMYKVPDESRFVTRLIDMLIMEVGNELWLAPGTPRYWLEPGKIIELYNTATKFGNVSFELKNGTIPNTIEGSITLPENMSQGKVKLFIHAPFGKPIKSVVINDKEWENRDCNNDAIVLPTQDKKITVLVSY